jgi:hypothetical protein
MNEYTFCPLTKKKCVEYECAWWVNIMGKGGCALRCLGGLVAGEILCNECKETLKAVINALYGKEQEHT